MNNCSITVDTKLPLLHRLYPQARDHRHVACSTGSTTRCTRQRWCSTPTVPGAAGNGVVGYALDALREALHGEHPDKLLLLTHRTLTHESARALAAVYEHIGEPPFDHDFGNVEYDASEFDAVSASPVCTASVLS